MIRFLITIFLFAFFSVGTIGYVETSTNSKLEGIKSNDIYLGARTAVLRKLNNSLIIDVTSDEAFLVRTDGDSGDVFTVDTNGADAGVIIGGIATTTGNVVWTAYDCSGNSNGGALTSDASGNISCSDDDSSAGGTGSNWSFDTNYGESVLTPSTTIAVWIKDDLYASSTLKVTGATTLYSTLDVTGTITGNLTGNVTGNADTATNASNDDLSDDDIDALQNVAAMTEVNGDLFYYNSNWDRLAIGTGGYILAVSNGLPVWVASSSIDTTLTQEQVEDYTGAMVTGNTETLITVTYQDGDGTIDFVVDNDLANYDNATSGFNPQAYASSTYPWAADWTTIDDYPSACGAGDYVTAIGDTLTCSAPAGTAASNWSYDTTNELAITPSTTIAVWIKDDLYASSTLRVVGAVNFEGTLDVVGAITGSLTGNADTATALAANPTTCTNQFVRDLDADGTLTCATVDTSADTNLAVSGTLLDLTGDTLSVNEGTLTDTKACIYTSGTGLVCNTTLTTGTVTSVDMSVPTGLTISGNPITGSGTLALAMDSGYLIPTSTRLVNADTAYSWGDHSVQSYLTVVTSTNMASDDFGDFSCDGTDLGCTLDATYLTGNETITLSGDVSGSGATAITTTIGNDKILEAHLKAVDSAADEECLTYESTTGDFEWQTCGGGSSPWTDAGTYLYATNDEYLEISYLIATSTNATSTFVDNIDIQGNSTLGTVIGGTWQGGVIATAYLHSNVLLTGELDSISELNTQIADATILISGGTLTNTQVCVADGTGGALDCNIAQADFLFETELDAFSELQTQIGDKTLINEEDAILFDNTLNASSTLQVGGAVRFYGALEVTGLTTLGNASTTELSVSGNSYLGTVLSGTWNGTAIDFSTYTNATAGTGITFTDDSIAADLGTSIDTTEIDADTITYADILDSDQGMTFCFYLEDPVAADDLQTIYMNRTANDFLITEISCESDQTIDFDFQIDDGTPADVSTADLQCAAGEAEDVSLGGDTTLAADEELDLVVTSVANTPTWALLCWTGNWVD